MIHWQNIERHEAFPRRLPKPAQVSCWLVRWIGEVKQKQSWRSIRRELPVCHLRVSDEAWDRRPGEEGIWSPVFAIDQSLALHERHGSALPLSPTEQRTEYGDFGLQSTVDCWYTGYGARRSLWWEKRQARPMDVGPVRTSWRGQPSIAGVQCAVCIPSRSPNKSPVGCSAADVPAPWQSPDARGSSTLLCSLPTPVTRPTPAACN